MKNSINVLVIDNNLSFTNEITNHFENHAIINIKKVINDGIEGLNEIISNYKDYDLIVMDILIPGVDGIQLLDTIEQNSINCKILIVTSYKQEQFVKSLSACNVNYFMIKPIMMDILEKRILQLFIEDKAFYKELSNNIINDISDMLHRLGIPSHLSGYSYLRESIYMSYINNDELISYTKEIYPEVALKYNTTSSKVERAIRHAIEVAWGRGDIDYINKLFGNTIAVYKDKPTNSEFIATITDKLRLNNKRYFL